MHACVTSAQEDNHSHHLVAEAQVKMVLMPAEPGTRTSLAQEMDMFAPGRTGPKSVAHLMQQGVERRAVLKTVFDEVILLAQHGGALLLFRTCLLYTSPSPRDRTRSRMPSSA